MQKLNFNMDNNELVIRWCNWRWMNTGTLFRI